MNPLFRYHTMTVPEILQEVFYLVEATDYERFTLWKDFSYESDTRKPDHGINWESKGSMGHMVTLGYIDDRPICMSILWCRLNGKLIGFWELTSELCDYKMAEDYLKKYKSEDCLMTDANNFHQCYHAIKEKVNG